MVVFIGPTESPFNGLTYKLQAGFYPHRKAIMHLSKHFQLCFVLFCQVLRLKPDVEWCQLEAHKEPVTCADFGTTSKYLLLATGSKDHMVRLWDAGSFTRHVTAKTGVSVWEAGSLTRHVTAKTGVSIWDAGSFTSHGHVIAKTAWGKCLGCWEFNKICDCQDWGKCLGCLEFYKTCDC